MADGSNPMISQVSWINYYSANTAFPVLLPLTGPPSMILGLAILCVLTNRMGTNDVPITSYKVFPLATLGVANHAMTRTGPGEPLVQEEGET